MELAGTEEECCKQRYAHINWVYEQEAKGQAIHTLTYEGGPAHPNSYLLYNDTGILVFQRDNADRYTSYTFWLNHLSYKEPIEHLGTEYFSAKELGVSPAHIEELYNLQSLIMKKGWTTLEDIDRLRQLQEEMQQAFSKIEAVGGYPQYQQMYQPPKPSALPVDYELFIKSLTADEQRLIEIAKDKLGSSFFVQWCHLYITWKAKQLK